MIAILDEMYHFIIRCRGPGFKIDALLSIPYKSEVTSITLDELLT